MNETQFRYCRLHIAINTPTELLPVFLVGVFFLNFKLKFICQIKKKSKLRTRKLRNV